jgi:hypothetical protein
MATSLPVYGSTWAEAVFLELILKTPFFLKKREGLKL